MGDVINRSGRKIGTVNAWSGVYDASGRKVGSIDIYSNRVSDAAGRFVGTADWYGKVHSPSGSLLCEVAFFGGRVKDAFGNAIGSVDSAGAPEPPPDMQWRGTAALLLLCDPRYNPPDWGRVAFDYLSTLAPDLRRQLIEAGADAVVPLARALAARFMLLGKDVRSQGDRDRVKDDWDARILNGILRPASEVITGIGATAIGVLVRALQGADHAVQKAMALLLATGGRPDAGAVTALAELLKRGKIDDTTNIMLLTFVLAHGGDARARRAVAEFAISNQMDVGDCLTRTIDSAVLELLGWEQGMRATF